MHKRKSRADDDGSGAAPAAAAAIDDDVAPDTVIVKHETYDEHAAQWFLLKATASDLGVKWQSKPPAEFEQLKRKVARWCKARGRVEYHLGKNGTADGAGRWIASGGRGLQSFTRPLRGLLAATRYWDVDMENAQPVLLLQLARKRGWEIRDFRTARKAARIGVPSALALGAAGGALAAVVSRRGNGG